MREYWMYFPFFMLHDWVKRSAEARSSHCAVLPRFYSPKLCTGFPGKNNRFLSDFFPEKGQKSGPGGNFRFPEKWGQKTESLPIVRTMETIYKKKAIFRGKLYGSFRKKA